MMRSALVTLLGLLLLSAPARASEDDGFRSSLQIVVDASTSMAAKSGDASLLTHALEAVRGAVEARGARPPGRDVAVRLAGGSAQRDKEDACLESSLLVPIGVSVGPVLSVQAPSLPARGPRALTHAVEIGASDFPRGSQRSLLVITTGADGCGRDVCELARELRVTPGLGQVRVVLLGQDKAAVRRLDCLGRVTVLDSPAGLAREVTRSLDAAFDPALVTFTAMRGDESVPARVELYPAGEPAPVVRAKTGEQVPLAAGRWDVRVVLEEGGQVRDGWRRDIELSAGSQLNLRVPMQTAMAELRVRVRLNGEDVPPSSRVIVHPVGDPTREIASGFPNEVLRLPPGRYDVRAEIVGSAVGSVEVWRPSVEVKEGETTRLTLDAAQRVGHLRVNVKSGRETLDDAEVLLLPNGSREDGTTVLIAGRASLVPEGTYTVLARLETPGGFMEAFEDDVQVRRNEPQDLTVDIGPTGVLVVEVAGHGEASGISVALMIPGELESVGEIEAFGQYRLPVGRYDLRVQLPGLLPRMWWLRGIEVTANELKRVKSRVP